MTFTVRIDVPTSAGKRDVGGVAKTKRGTAANTGAARDTCGNDIRTAANRTTVGRSHHSPLPQGSSYLPVLRREPFDIHTAARCVMEQ